MLKNAEKLRGASKEELFDEVDSTLSQIGKANDAGRKEFVKDYVQYGKAVLNGPFWDTVMEE